MVTYAFQVGRHGAIYEGPGKDGAPLTLVRAMRECRGVFDARILRLDRAGHWTVVVHNAGSIYSFEHVGATGTVRTITRRRRVNRRHVIPARRGT